ncbi:MAG: hypothetical protein ACLQDY_06630 [Streptosporangiaceae bacterium]
MTFEVSRGLTSPPTLGERIDAQFEMDEQTFEALDRQHRALADRVAALEVTVRLLRSLALGSEAAHLEQ